MPEANNSSKTRRRQTQAPKAGNRYRGTAARFGAGSPEKPEEGDEGEDHGGDEKPQEKAKAQRSRAHQRADETGARGRARSAAAARSRRSPACRVCRSRRRTSSGRMTNTSKRWPTGKQISASPNRSGVATLSGDKRRKLALSKPRRKPGRSARAISAARRRTMTRLSGNRLSR